MSIFGRLFKKPELSRAPERYPTFYLRWARDGESYGPMFFDAMFPGWRNDPVQGRFSNEQHWRPFSDFREILAHLHASRAQVERLAELGAPIASAEALTYTQAFARISELEEASCAARKQRQAELDAGPVQPSARKNLAKFGIDCPDDLTHGEAKRLVRARKAELAVQAAWKDINVRFKRLGVNLDPATSLAWESRDRANSSPMEDLEELLCELDDLPALAQAFPWPSPVRPADAEVLLEKISAAVRAAEDAEDATRERELIVDQGQYRLVGKMPKAQLNDLRLAVAMRQIAGEYSEQRDLLPLIQQKLPDLEFRDLDY